MSNVSDIYTKGYVKFYEPDGLDLIKINDHRLLNTEERARDNGKEDIDHLLANTVAKAGRAFFLASLVCDTGCDLRLVGPARRGPMADRLSRRMGYADRIGFKHHDDLGRRGNRGIFSYSFYGP